MSREGYKREKKRRRQRKRSADRHPEKKLVARARLTGGNETKRGKRKKTVIEPENQIRTAKHTKGTSISP